MPQLVKGGKYIFGWSIITSERRIRIPDEAFDEYKFQSGEKLIIVSGSKASGGFSIIGINTFLKSEFVMPLIKRLGYSNESDTFKLEMNKIVFKGARWFCWTGIDKEKYFKISSELIELIGVKKGDKLLVGRGSGIGPAFISKGLIVNEAKKHTELICY